MPRATYIQSSFNAGEWSPLLYGRTDLPKRRNAAGPSLNYVATLQGPQTRRPGTAYVAAAADNANVRLQRFEFSTTQAYVLEFTPGKIRFYVNGGQLLSAGVPYEVATPYTAGDLPGLCFTQSADVLYIVHPNYPPKTLSRLAATNWVLANMTFIDGPYLPRNVTATKMSLSDSTPGATGVTLTATSTVGINGGLGFQAATDVGRVFRVNNTSTTAGVATWVYGVITAVTNTTNATVSLLGLSA
jgi:hypothetical protein